MNLKKKSDEIIRVILSSLLPILVLLLVLGLKPVWAAPIIIDHNSISEFASLSDVAIDKVQANIRWHYAHTSHGGQLTTGLTRIENSDSKYNISIGNSHLPDESGALNVFNGQEGDTYIAPEEYWKTPAGIQKTKDVLNHNPSINVSAWSWCRQLNSYTTNDVQAYLNQMAAFEEDFPDVTFVYMTGNAQANGSEGANRYKNNNLIRDWVKNSDNRVLFDFADLDAWWFNGSEWEQATYEYDGQNIPIEHSHFRGDDSNHTTYESCEQKGKAVWVMMDKIQQTQAVPIPGAVWLLGSGLFGLVAVRRRRNNIS